MRAVDHPISSELAVVLNQWEAYLRYERNLSPHTIAAYLETMREFFSYLRRIHDFTPEVWQLSQITVSIFREWLASMARGRLSPNSIRRAVGGLRAFYRFMGARYHIRNDAPSLLSMPPQPRTLPKTLSVAQTLSIIDALGAIGEQQWERRRDQALAMLLYGAGLRIQEALDVHYREFIDAATTGRLRVTGKGRKERYAALLPEVAAAIRDYVRQCPHVITGEDYLFRSTRNLPLGKDGFNRKLKEAALAAKINLPVSAHTFRHCFATHMLEGSNDLRSVQELLGHASITTTQIYTHVTASRLMDAYRQAHPGAVKSSGTP